MQLNPESDMAEYEHGISPHGEEIQEVSNYDIIMAHQGLSWNDMKEHMTGPLIAVVAHLIVLPMVIMMVVIPAPEEQASVEMEAYQEEVVPPEPPPEPEEPPPPQEVLNVEVERDRPDVSNEPIDEPVVDNPSLTEDPNPVEVPNTFNIETNNSAKVLSSLYANRNAGGRRGAVGRGGGSGEGQLSLNRGLNWLASVQKPDGSWGDHGGNSPAMTALAVLAFLAHGDLPSSPRYGQTVSKGIQKLVDYSNIPDARGKGMKCDGHQYGHSIVTYALAEAAAMTKIPVVIEAMDKSVKVIVDNMGKSGGYDYNYVTAKDRNDLSLGGWNYQALKAAFAAGSTVPNLAETLERAVAGIKHNKATNGNYYYYDENTKNSKAMAATLTPVAVLCLQLLGEGKSKEVKDGVDFIVNDRGGFLMDMNWKVRGARTDREVAWCLYAWYYQTQMLFQAGEGRKDDPNWKKWRQSFEKNLVAEQNSEGYWESPIAKYKHRGVSFAESGQASLGTEMCLRVYSTALCCLMLEVYYRFLPTYQLVTDKPAGGDGGDADEGLIKID